MNKEKTPKEIELKQTEGQKKVRQYTQDLLRNKPFMSLIEKLEEAKKTIPDKEIDGFLRLLKYYRKLDLQAKKLEQTLYGKSNKIKDKLAEEYGLDHELLRPILMAKAPFEDEKLKDDLQYDPLSTDFCIVVDNYDENLNPVYPPMPLSMDVNKQNHLKAFPVSIDIHRFTTKRSLLDFVEKRWPWIQNIIGAYNDDKNIRFRTRKYGHKFLDFIWDHRNLSDEELKTRVDTQFPGNNFVYYEFRQIIAQEEKRRNRKITVGQ